MNDWSYDRMAELLADAIAEAALPPVYTVRARLPGKMRS
jgi:hypothetical protein